MSPPSDDDGGSPPGRQLTRRGVLACLGGGVALATTSRAPTDVAADGGPVHIRVYPGSLSALRWAWLRMHGARSRWAPPFEAAFEAVDGAFNELAAYAADAHNLSLDVTVERGAPVDLSLALQPSIFGTVSPTQQGLLDAFRDVLAERGVLTGRCCHLLLWWGPFHHEIGYGGMRQPNTHVAAVDGEGAQVVANIGATEWWDSRAVTRNIAIHEAFHTYLSSPDVKSVIDSSCDHNLGTAVRVDERTLEVSPMATAYAGDERLGHETRFHGTACYDHDSFYRHDGYEGVDRWRHTTTLSEGTLEAATGYVSRNLL